MALVDNRRVRYFLEKKTNGPILYWMSRDQRINDNWALLYAQELALTKKQPFIIIFLLQREFLNAESRIFDFMIDGLELLEKSLNVFNIPFVLLKGKPEIEIVEFIKKNKIGTIVTDFSPLKTKKKWNESLKEELTITFCEVDAHNIIPCWVSSDKKEYAAYTIRSRINKLLPEFLTEFPKIKRHPYSLSEEKFTNNWNNLRNFVKVEKSKNELDWIKPGEKESRKVLNEFLRNKLKNYEKERNDPNKDATSNLSPYLHFGHLSSQRVVLESVKIKKITSLKGSFYDEIIVRRELSDNFCFYDKNYDNFNGFHSWAQETLNAHRDDKREYLYNLDELENARTHDPAWNAAQIELIQIGKMHGYMRMYWGKKILEWTSSPEEAQSIAIYLNDKYQLDGRDPNGYTGIAWSIGGVHDRAWNERKIFGKIRYMGYDGLKRKFDLGKYIERYT